MTRMARPAVRLRPVPPLDPPFEDVLAPEIWSSGSHPGQLALNLRLAPTRGTVPTAIAAPTGGALTRGAASNAGGPGPTSARTPQPIAQSPVPNAGPDARQAVRRFLATCLEILNGYRPLGHIRPLVSPTEVDAALAQLRAGVERLATPNRAARRAPAKVRLVRVCEPRPGVVEAAVVLSGPGRTWALAFRLERHRGRWVGATLRVL
jgi:Family of unknown function (DUF6459)